MTPMTDTTALRAALEAQGWPVGLSDETGNQEVWWRDPSTSDPVDLVVPFTEDEKSVVTIPPWLDTEGTTYVIAKGGGQAMASSVEDVIRLLEPWTPKGFAERRRRDDALAAISTLGRTLPTVELEALRDRLLAEYAYPDEQEEP